MADWQALDLLANAASKDDCTDEALYSVLLKNLDETAGWPKEVAKEFAQVARTCLKAGEQDSPLPGIASISGCLLNLCLRCQAAESLERRSKGVCRQPSPADVMQTGHLQDVIAGIECVFSSKVDVSKLGFKQKGWLLRESEAPWKVGRQHQPDIFNTIVPDEVLVLSIARSHFELHPQSQEEETPGLQLHLLPHNPLKVDAEQISSQSTTKEVCIRSGSEISLCHLDEVLITLKIWMKPSDAKPKRPSVHSGHKESTPAPHQHQVGLVCESISGKAVEALPMQARVISLHTSNSTEVGRQHQQGFFEHVLPIEDSAQPFLSCVSRTHFQISPTSFTRTYEITNFSINPILVAGKALEKNGTTLLKMDERVELTVKGSDEKTVSFMTFCLKQLGSTKAAEPSNDLDATLQALPIMRKEAVDAQEPKAPFYLTLAGSAVQKDFPEESRKVNGSLKGLTIGRAHQREIHEKALNEEIQRFVSRDHFSIRCSAASSFLLVPLSQNPIWHVRGQKRKELMRDESPIPLRNGDYILLFTGGKENVGEGETAPSLRWIFCCPEAASSLDPIEEKPQDSEIPEASTEGTQDGLNSSETKPNHQAADEVD